MAWDFRTEKETVSGHQRVDFHARIDLLQMMCHDLRARRERGTRSSRQSLERQLVSPRVEVAQQLGTCALRAALNRRSPETDSLKQSE